MNEFVGKLIKKDDVVYRDAFHVAVAPVTAAMDLDPGQHIGFVTNDHDVEHVGVVDNPIGIVDPYLRQRVHKGARFLMHLYPNTITSLKHDWTHPIFVAKSGKLDADYVRAREWLETFGASNGQMNFEEAIQAADDWIDNGNYKSEGGRFESCYVPDEFWDHYEVITGRKVSEHHRNDFFSCSC